MNYKEEYEKWKKLDFLEPELKKELKKIENDETAIKNQFSYYVEFGTAGMRGTMGVGPNRMNFITIRRTTIGLAKFIKKNHAEKAGVAIIYDSRINSKEFANYIAKTLTEFNIRVFISRDIRPTPFLSYAVLNMKTFAGINITASHNRKEDNGYKIYLKNGAQFSSPDDKEIIKLVNEVTEKEMYVNPDDTKPNEKLISIIPKEIEDGFLENAVSHIIHKDFCKKNGKELKVVYTPLHGTGYTFLEEGFKKAGFTNVSVVKEQNDKCGEFKTVAYPNPESAAAFELALKLAKKKDADIVVATDPDADRLGVYVKEKDGSYVALTGNELASVIFEYILYFKKGLINYKNSMAAKSFVTTRLIDAIAERYGVELKVTPTGFKWIGKMINESKKNFIFGCEESYGCLLSDYVRDKDAIGTTLLVLEIALALKRSNFTLYEMLKMLYNYYGVYKNYSFSITYEGVSGKEKMASMMKSLRDKPFTRLTDIDTLKVYDYATNEVLDMKSSKKEHFDFITNDTVKFLMADKTAITIRPSGTEPKIKIYFDIIDETDELADNKNKILESALKKILV